MLVVAAGGFYQMENLEMFIARSLLPLGLLLLCATARPVLAQEDQTAGREKIAWLGIWSEAKDVAAATGRPIFLLSAAPRCRDVPGIW